MRPPRLCLFHLLLISVVFASAIPTARAQEPPPDRRSDGEKARDYAQEAPEILKDRCRTERVNFWIRFLDRKLPEYERERDHAQEQNSDALLHGKTPSAYDVREAQLLGEAIPTLRKALEDLKRLPPCETKSRSKKF